MKRNLYKVMSDNFVIEKSTRPDKKWMVKVNNRTVHFGQRGASDFTTNKSDVMRKSYLARHSRMGEDWTKKGVETAGFWSRWLLWEKLTLSDAIRNIEGKFKINIILKN